MELQKDLAVQVCKALIACVDELTVHHVVKYGHLEDTQNPAILLRMEQEDQVRQNALPVLNELCDRLTAEGVDPIA